MGRAKCRGVDPALFYPDRGGDSQAIAANAKAVCWGEDGMPICAVRQACLEFAMVHHERFGVWGGLSERERNRLRKQWEQDEADHKANGQAEAVRGRRQVRQRAAR